MFDTFTHSTAQKYSHYLFKSVRVRRNVEFVTTSGTSGHDSHTMVTLQSHYLYLVTLYLVSSHNISSHTTYLYLYRVTRYLVTLPNIY